MRNHKLLYCSSYDRGLDCLLFIWQDIKKDVPDAELYIAYGWDLFDKVARNNPERMEWKKRVETMMQQDGIYHLGRIGKEELRRVRERCGILAYPSYFEEINCLAIIESALEAGVVPVSMAYAAIPETLENGVFVDGDIRQMDALERYKCALVSLMKDDRRWKELSVRCQQEAQKKYRIGTIANKWVAVFNEPVDDISVSVITPTIREGFWGSMTSNLLGQTYRNFEWVVVDDYPEDRSDVARRYENERFAIKYVRGDKALGKYHRRLGLVRANNKAWGVASGELLIWLQDFVYLPKDGIESIVDLYRHNKDSLIAPVDIYYEIVEPNLANKVDWFDGKMEGEYPRLGKEMWRNRRVKFSGVRESDNHFDFELNCGAIPKKVLQNLNGFWEFMDDGLGYDNAEIAYRALKMGYRLIVDDSIIVKCADLWQVIKGTDQNISSRERILNPPRYQFLIKKMEEHKIPIIRDAELDGKIRLEYDIPDGIPDDMAAEWVAKHTNELVKIWEDSYAI